MPNDEDFALTAGEDAPSTAPADPTEIEAAVTRWFNDFIANSPVSRNVEAINHKAIVAVPALVARLNQKG